MMPDKPPKPYRPIENVIIGVALIICATPMGVFAGQAILLGSLIVAGGEPSSIQALSTAMDHGETTRTLVIGAAIGSAFGLINNRSKNGLKPPEAVCQRSQTPTDDQG